MANNTPIAIAKTDASGAFVQVGSISLAESNSVLEVLDLDDERHEFDIPEEGALSFVAGVTVHEPAKNADYFIIEAAPKLVASGSFELNDNLNLRLELEGRQEASALFLKFIGEDAIDILRSAAEHNLMQGAEFGFQKTGNSVILKVFAPEK